MSNEAERAMYRMIASRDEELAKLRAENEELKRERDGHRWSDAGDVERFAPCSIQLDVPSAMHSAMADDGALAEHIRRCHPGNWRTSREGHELRCSLGKPTAAHYRMRCGAECDVEVPKETERGE